MRNGVVCPVGLCDKEGCVCPNPGLVVGGFNESCGMWCCVGGSVGKGARPEGETLGPWSKSAGSAWEPSATVGARGC